MTRSEPRAEGLRAALLRIFDLAENRPDIREVARAALAATPPAPALDAIHGATEAMKWALPVIIAVRAWRDTPARDKRAMAAAEQAMLDAIGDLDEYAALAPEQPKHGPYGNEGYCYCGVFHCEEIENA